MLRYSDMFFPRASAEVKGMEVRGRLQVRTTCGRPYVTPVESHQMKQRRHAGVVRHGLRVVRVLMRLEKQNRYVYNKKRTTVFSALQLPIYTNRPPW